MIVQVEGLDGDALTALNRKQPSFGDVETWGKQVWVRAPLELDMPSQFCTPSPPKFWTVRILLGPAFAGAAVQCKPRRPPIHQHFLEVGRVSQHTFSDNFRHNIIQDGDSTTTPVEAPKARGD